MTPHDLKELGQSLYGWGWQTALANELELSPRQIRRYVSGEDPIPKSVELALYWLQRKQNPTPR